ncbi:glycosyltransferase [Marinivivus vitaminiproducens]|uniref:glycosyltransferase n=1 Tax=Marinivivus vitaminiproducens TaxID=3035935 RepID=UPI00279B7BB2|nr:glycosyltransferase family A protein [Geminicoccaceae bacterium SCSIO 64248]
MDDFDAIRLDGLDPLDTPPAAQPGPTARLLHPVVAIPVRNEAARLGRCLDALIRQDVPAASKPLTLVLVLNNCTDDSLAVAERFLGRRDVELRILAVRLPEPHAHVGTARRLAMDEAAAILEAQGRVDGAILTTDADTVVAADWVRRTLDAFADGADVVAGTVRSLAGEPALPRRLRDPLAREQIYRRLLCAIGARLDPLPHDPWPCHDRASGASLAVRAEHYRRIGGLPAVRAGEDRALVQALTRIDARVRHSPAVQVATSCRLVGRAPGGLADTLARQAAGSEAWCDPELEPVERFVRRVTWRRRLRAWREQDGWGPVETWAGRLGIPPLQASVIALEPHFGRMWEQIQAASAHLRHQSIPGADLPRAIGRARRLLRRLDAARPADRPGDAPGA